MSRYVRSTVLVSKQFFKQCQNHSFGNRNVTCEKIKPDKLIFTSPIVHNELVSVKNVLDCSFSVYQKAHNDFMPCIDEIEIQDVYISENYQATMKNSYSNKEFPIIHPGIENLVCFG